MTEDADEAEEEDDDDEERDFSWPKYIGGEIWDLRTRWSSFCWFVEGKEEG